MFKNNYVVSATLRGDRVSIEFSDFLLDSQGTFKVSLQFVSHSRNKQIDCSTWLCSTDSRDEKQEYLEALAEDFSDCISKPSRLADLQGIVCHAKLIVDSGMGQWSLYLN